MKRRYTCITLGDGDALVVAGSLRKWSRRIARHKRARKFMRVIDVRSGELLLNPNGWVAMREVAR